jgi:hypothetical protein
MRMGPGAKQVLCLSVFVALALELYSPEFIMFFANVLCWNFEIITTRQAVAGFSNTGQFIVLRRHLCTVIVCSTWSVSFAAILAHFLYAAPSHWVCTNSGERP